MLSSDACSLHHNPARYARKDNSCGSSMMLYCTSSPNVALSSPVYPYPSWKREVGISYRARLAEVFVERKEYHKGIAATMPNGILGQDFAIQHLQVTWRIPKALLMFGFFLWRLLRVRGGGVRDPVGRAVPSPQGYMWSLCRSTCHVRGA